MTPAISDSTQAVAMAVEADIPIPAAVAAAAPPPAVAAALSMRGQEVSGPSLRKRVSVGAPCAPLPPFNKVLLTSELRVILVELFTELSNYLNDPDGSLDLRKPFDLAKQYSEFLKTDPRAQTQAALEIARLLKTDDPARASQWCDAAINLASSSRFGDLNTEAQLLKALVEILLNSNEFPDDDEKVSDAAVLAEDSLLADFLQEEVTEGFANWGELPENLRPPLFNLAELANSYLNQESRADGALAIARYYFNPLLTKVLYPQHVRCALAWHEKAIALNPSDQVFQDAHYESGLIYLRTTNRSMAKQHFTKAANRGHAAATAELAKLS